MLDVISQAFVKTGFRITLPMRASRLRSWLRCKPWRRVLPFGLAPTIAGLAGCESI